MYWLNQDLLPLKVIDWLKKKKVKSVTPLSKIMNFHFVDDNHHVRFIVEMVITDVGVRSELDTIPPNRFNKTETQSNSSERLYF